MIWEESQKQTKLLTEILKLLKPPIVLEGSIPEQNRERIMKILEDMGENTE
ncbi:hypothetical protein [Methanobrevibacter sp.]|uniref:hypothetical protein n=1 Tax=Methanobrevibacter sp. TaxID=66852 RepID=UPI0038678A40